jgi:hypothetical protein
MVDLANPDVLGDSGDVDTGRADYRDDIQAHVARGQATGLRRA